MDGMVVSSSLQMLEDLQEKNEFKELVHDKVKELVLALEKIEKLLNNDRNNKKVMENMENIRNLAKSIVDALETWVDNMELARMPNNNDKKRGIPRFLRRCFGREYDDGNVSTQVRTHTQQIINEMFLRGSRRIKWLYDTFPEDILGSGAVDRRKENHKTFRRSREMSARGVEEHFVWRNDELNDLISLVAEDRKHHVVTIWGAKGLGKTTLAKKVYGDHKVRSHFKAFAWVSLHRGYESGNLLHNILNQLRGGAVTESPEEKKKSAENYRRNMKKQGGGAEKKSEGEKEGAEEQEKGAEEKKKLAEEKGEGVEEQSEGEEEKEKKECAVEKKKGAKDKKEGFEEQKKMHTREERKRRGESKGCQKIDTWQSFTEHHERSAGSMKKSSDEHINAEEEKKEGDGDQKEGAEEKKKWAKDKKEGFEEQEKGTEEKKEGAEEKTKFAFVNHFPSMMKPSLGSMKKSSKEQINAAEEKKEGYGEEKKKRGAEEKQKGDVGEIEEAEEKKKGAEEKDKGDMEKMGGPEERKDGEEKHEKGIEEQNKGADKKKIGVEKQEKDSQDLKKGSLFQNMKKRSVEVVKKFIEPKQGEEEKKEAAEEKNNDADELQKSSKDEMPLPLQLREILSHKSCLVVIDGISELNQWKDISSALVMPDTDTKILLTVTTNDETTAFEDKDFGHSHRIMSLLEEEGWELLQKYAFHGKTAPEFGVVPKLGKEMVAKCGYLPSKISSLGRTLSAMSLSDWHKVNDNVTEYLQKDHQSEPNKRSYNDVNPCYDNLPYSQKQCFLYLAIFKANEDVDPEDLSFLWMGEGMVFPQQHEKHRKETIMDTTEYYLRELYSKRMLNLKVDELSANRRFLPLSPLNHVRQLSLNLGEKEDFRLEVVDFSDGKQPEFGLNTYRRRRLAIHFNKLSSPGKRKLKPTYYLRSLLFLNSDREYVSLPVRISDFKKFTLLRVLHFVRCKFEGGELPEGIWKLLNLRYFGLLYCDLDKLPESISNLRYLRVLNVRSYDDAIIAIPNTISQLTRLKHLRLPHKSDCEQYHKKVKLDGLVDLQTLVGFNADIHDIDSLSELKNLRYLGIHASSNDSLKSIIKKFSSKMVKSDGADVILLRISLSIEDKCDFTSPEGVAILEELLMCPNLNELTFFMVLIYNFPNCGKYASSDLTQIKLIGCKLSENPMKALGKFPNLRKLCLGYGAFVGKEMAVSDEGFSKLEDLEFRCLPNLEEWIVDEGALPSLSALTVVRCPKLKSIPEELVSVYSLKNMEIELEPSVDDSLLEKYQRMFDFVKSRDIRKLDPLSAGSSSAH